MSTNHVTTETAAGGSRSLRRGGLAVAVACASLAAAAAPAAAQNIRPDPTVWRSVIDHDFRRGDAPIYKKYCGHVGASKNGSELSNFSHANIYWQSGALVLKFERRRNTSCTGVTRNYAGGGFELIAPGATQAAIEIEAQGTDAPAVQPYAGLFARDVKPRCQWGAEDDFFEMHGSRSPRIGQTYHYWDSSCRHSMKQFFTEIPNIATTYHAFGAIREHSGTRFYIDGVFKGWANNMFTRYPVKLSMGVLAKSTYGWPDDRRLPETILIRRIRLWHKR